jgi:hypothetical protein
MERVSSVQAFSVDDDGKRWWSRRIVVMVVAPTVAAGLIGGGPAVFAATGPTVIAGDPSATVQALDRPLLAEDGDEVTWISKGIT